MRKVKIGVIGTGGIGAGAHLPAYAALENVEVVAVCDRIVSRAQAAAEKFSVKHVFDKHQDLLALSEIDAVDICTPNAYHKPITVDALRKGKHVLVEKPMAMNAAECRVMIDEAKKANRTLMVAQCLRFSADARFLKDVINSGALGEIYYAEAIFTRRRGIPGWGVFTEKKESGAGPLFDLGVHVIDLAMHLMGYPTPVSVSGQTFCKIGNSPHHAEIAKVCDYWPWDANKFEVEDLAVGLVRLENGGCLYLKTSWAANLPEDDSINVVLVGTEGGCQTNPLSISHTAHGKLLTSAPTRLPKLDTYKEEIKAFIDAFTCGNPSPVPGEQAVVTIGILDGIHKSAATGKEVKLTRPAS